MTTVTVTGYGTFAIPSNKIDELLQWLRSNSSQLESTSRGNDNRTLLNESNNNH